MRSRVRSSNTDKWKANDRVKREIPLRNVLHEARKIGRDCVGGWVFDSTKAEGTEEPRKLDNRKKKGRSMNSASKAAQQKTKRAVFAVFQTFRPPLDWPRNSAARVNRVCGDSL